MLETAEVEELKTKTEELGQELQKVGQAMYASADSAQDQQAEQGKPTGDSEEVKNEKQKDDEDKGDVKEGEVVEE